jgi:CHAT domain-containing protein
LIEQKKAEEALERWEMYRSRPMLRDLTAGMHGTSHRGVTQSPNFSLLNTIKSAPETRIVYADFDDGIYIWISREGSIRSQWVAIKKQDFENMAREFAEKCAVEGSNLRELNQLGTKLFSLLLQPVISDISSAHSVIIELDRVAYSLPMEALSSPEGWYFGERYSVIYSPGLWVEKTLRLPKGVSGQESLVLLDASHAVGAGYLPGLETQKTTITRLFPRNRIIDSSKTSWNDSRSRLASSQIFHYMGHGKPDGSGTSLDYDGTQLLRAKDFTPQLLKNSQIVLLAACSGAAGRDNGLADTNNLVRAFLSAGVPSVIASHWNVDSASTSRLMVGFYQHLAKGDPVARAMYNARIDVLRTKAHPYFWAGFTLAGRTN